MLETLLSVIIPVYNVEPYLEQCLDSVINQTYKNMEIICVNDGSTDNSSKILEKYRLKDKRIKVISQKNKGLSEARNVSIKIAKGKYIGFVDSDDFIEPTMYEKLVTPMIKDPSIDFSEANFKRFWEKGCYRKGSSVGVVTKIEGKHHVVLSFPVHYDLVVWNKVYKRSIILEKKIDFPKGLYHEDLSFSPAYLANSRYAYSTPEYLYNYRMRNDSICGIESEEKHEKRKIDVWKIGLYFYEYLKNNGLFELHKDYMEKFMLWTVCLMSGNELKTFSGKWMFVKEFFRFLIKTDYPISGKISLTGALVQGIIASICHKLYLSFLS